MKNLFYWGKSWNSKTLFIILWIIIGALCAGKYRRINPYLEW